MKKLERFEIIDRIGRELQTRMTFSDIETYLGGYGIDCSITPSANSKYVFVKEVLAKVEERLIVEIGTELEIDHPALSNAPVTNLSDLKVWKSGFYRLFISHLAEHKVKMSALKKALENYCISGFVAHEDIEPTKEWQTEIEKALFSMDALLAVLTPKFNESKWTDQEIGVAMGRNVLVIPIRKGIDPYGFIGKYQGFQSNGKTVGEVAKGIFDILSTNNKTKNILFDTITNLLLQSKNFDEANKRLELLTIFKSISENKISYLHAHFSENDILSNKEILEKANDIFIRYNLSSINENDFKPEIVKDEDDLPF